MADLPRPESLLGQETALRAFGSALATGRVAGAYLLHGPPGTGRSLGAAIFANALLCERPRGLAPCGVCRACRWNELGTHPDLLMIGADTGPRFDDDAEAARAGPDQFSRAARAAAKRVPRKIVAVRALRRLMELLALAPAGGGWKVVVLDSFDDVEEEGTAALLKTLEEAPPRTTFLLLARDADSVPDTILSRCQRVRFRPLEPAVARRVAVEVTRGEPGGAASLDPASLDLLVRLAQGSPGRAVQLARFGVHDVPRRVVSTLGDAPAAPPETMGWVKEGTKDLDGQRERLRELLALALLETRDRWGPGSALRVGALRGALESLDANVSPELVVRALWTRAHRLRSLTF